MTDSSYKSPVRIKLIDAFTNVEKTKQNSSHICLYTLLQYFNINHYSDSNEKKFEKRVKGYYVYSHYCTDTTVGLEAIYMDDKLIGYKYLEHRKSRTEYKFLSRELMKQLRDFVGECIITDIKDDSSDIITEEELQKEITIKDWC